MSSAAQIAANRANAAHSTGPVTEAGKATSRLNAARHGLNSPVACMPWEDREAFHQFCSALVAEYRPEGLIETELAQSIAEDHWRLNRARAIEHNIFALSAATSTPPVDSGDQQIDAALAQAQTFCDQAKTLGLLTLYEQRINRSVHRNLERLRHLQSDRREAFEQALAQRAERRALNREHDQPTMRSSDTQRNRPGLIPTAGPQEAKPLVDRSGLIPTGRPQEPKSLVTGFVHSNDRIDTSTRHRSLDERIAEVESVLLKHQNLRSTPIRTAA